MPPDGQPPVGFTRPCRKNPATPNHQLRLSRFRQPQAEQCPITHLLPLLPIEQLSQGIAAPDRSFSDHVTTAQVRAKLLQNAQKLTHNPSLNLCAVNGPKD